MTRMKVPVLMYHALSDNAKKSYAAIHISTDLFLQQLEWLVKNNYRSISIDEMLLAFKDKKSLTKTFMISFDDGYYSLYQHAMPALKKNNFTATLFLTTNTIGKKNFDSIPDIVPASLPADDRPLTWQEIKTMQQNGWSIQSHSITHSDNSKLDTDQLRYELIESKKIIEAELQQPVLHYAFPFGKYNAESLKALPECGYESAFTVHSGLCSPKNNLFRLPRLEMTTNDDIEIFAKKMMTGFGSAREKLKATARNIAFSNPAVKDISKKIIGKKMN